MTYSFSDDPERIDFDLVYRWLSEDSYWAKGRSRALQDEAAAGSRNYGMFDDASGEQVAYARVITDGAIFAWLADVFVDPEVRGRGVGIALIENVMAELVPLGLGRIGLVTSDAHELYAKFGFEPLADPDRWMTWTPKQS